MLLQSIFNAIPYNTDAQLPISKLDKSLAELIDNSKWLFSNLYAESILVLSIII